ncbi:MAG: hypothetical protein CMH52_08525 [Myxococcales bacterium]|nr:hypothetical protein [Myxococcales bacterium]
MMGFQHIGCQALRYAIAGLALFVTMGCGDEEMPSANSLLVIESKLEPAHRRAGDGNHNPAKNNTIVDPLDKSRGVAFISGRRLATLSDHVDDPRQVRETGFMPIDEDDDDPRFVRETGFVPSPRIRLAAMRGQIATIEWAAVDDADHYLVNGIRFSDRGGPAESFEYRVDATFTRVNTEGRVTQVMVVAVAAHDNRRSRPSNKLTIIPDED